MYSQLAPELFGFFLANIPLAVAMLDRQMCYLCTSCQWLSDYGLENQSIIGRSHNEVFPRISSEWRDIQERCLLGSVEQCEKDCWTRADGITIWVKWQLQPWRNQTHEIGGLILSTEVLAPTQLLSETNYRTVETTSIARYKENFVAHKGECSDEAEINLQHLADEAARAAKLLRSLI
jgi:PAS domain S-box-containing protein